MEKLRVDGGDSKFDHFESFQEQRCPFFHAPTYPCQGILIGQLGFLRSFANTSLLGASFPLLFLARKCAPRYWKHIFGFFIFSVDPYVWFFLAHLLMFSKNNFDFGSKHPFSHWWGGGASGSSYFKRAKIENMHLAFLAHFLFFKISKDKSIVLPWCSCSPFQTSFPNISNFCQKWPFLCKLGGAKLGNVRILFGRSKLAQNGKLQV